MNLLFALAVSTHLGIPGSFNEVHPTVKLEFDNNVSAGLYLNSQDRLSLAVGKTWESGDFWVEVGAATGYERAAVVPIIRFGVEVNDTKLFALPLITPDGKPGVVVGAEFTIKEIL